MDKLRRMPSYGVYALLAYMPFHIFLSHWLSLYTGGLGIWDSAKDVLTIISLIAALVLLIQHRLYRNRYYASIIGLSAAYFLLHLAFIFLNRNLYLRAAVLATLYNGRLFAYLIIAMVAGSLDKSLARNAIKVVIVASTITCLLAFVQYFGPKDLMTHFGYSFQRGVKPSFFIDDKPDFPRAFSTLRDPNSYGAYLIIPLVYLWVYINQNIQSKKKKLVAAGLLVLHLFVLYLTFSRGAWIGAIISLVLATMFAFKDKLIVYIKKYALLIIVAVLVFVPLVFILRNQYAFQNIFFHKDQKTVATDPNELRVQLQNVAARKIIDKPVGYGPGTAGIVSIGNPKGGLLTENYYLQIAYEVGLFGFAIFLSLVVLTYWRLARLTRSPLVIGLLASFWGYAFISLLIHLWSNEAIAAQWWLLAGVATGLPVTKLKIPRISHKTQS